MRSILLAFLPLLLAPTPRQETSNKKPNVLFIVVDDLNDWTGYLGGHPQAYTPNLDRLAARGVAFTQAYCPSPVCIPSRTAVLTGVLPHVSRIVNNIGQFREVMPDVKTLPQRLREGGYGVVSSGKVFHFPDEASWDAHLPMGSGHKMKDPEREAKGLDIRGLQWGPLDVDDAEMADQKVSDWVCKQLGMRKQKPFFLACGLVKPHLPWSVPERFFERFPLAEVQLPAVHAEDLDDLSRLGKQRARSALHQKLIKEDKWKAAVQAYLASVAYFDERLGEILDALEAGPNAEDTIVILWSDHGMSLGEKQHWKKSSLWEDANHVPLIFAGPGIPEGVRNTHAVGLIDLYRTTLELCGMPAPGSLAGYSLAGMLADSSLVRPAPVLSTVAREHTVRSDRWRLIRYTDGSEELYDHANDPHEWTNLVGVAEHDALRKKLGAWLPAYDTTPMQRKKGPRQRR